MDDLNKIETSDVLFPDGNRRAITMPLVNWECRRFLLMGFEEKEITDEINGYRKEQLPENDYSFEEFYSSGIAVMFNAFRACCVGKESEITTWRE